MIYLFLYIDDMLIAYDDREKIEHLKGLLSSKFEMKDLWGAKKILGIEIIRDKIRMRKIIFLTQRNYIKKVLIGFGMHYFKPIQTPFANYFKLSSI